MTIYIKFEENLSAVIRERQVITKWLLQRRQEEEQFLGMYCILHNHDRSSPKSFNYMKKEYEIESPITMEDKLLKIDKERQKTQ